MNAKKKIDEVERRSDCPVSCTLDLVGDKWSLLIIRDMMFFGKTSYNEFLSSDEGIATNILNDRLLKLTDHGIIIFSGTEKRKKYSLTKLGMGLMPILEAIGNFGVSNFPWSKEYAENLRKNTKI